MVLLREKQVFFGAFLGLTVGCRWRVRRVRATLPGLHRAQSKRQKDGAFPNGGGFQNGFVDRMGPGAEVFDWNGKPAGYEGHLVYCWAFLHSMLLKDPAIRHRARPFAE
jgi:hypothetical protein